MSAIYKIKYRKNRGPSSSSCRLEEYNSYILSTIGHRCVQTADLLIFTAQVFLEKGENTTDEQYVQLHLKNKKVEIWCRPRAKYIYCTKESRLYNLKIYIYSLPLVASVALIKIWIKVPVTKARASTRGWWCAGGPPRTRTVPGCHSWGRSPGWGRGWGRCAAAAGSGADSGGTEEQSWPKGRASGRVGAPGDQLERPGQHPRCFPLSPCSCWRWSGWPSADRTACRPGRFADRRGSDSAPPRPRDPSPAPYLPSGSAPHSPGSPPFPPLDSSCSKWMMMRNLHYLQALYFGEPQQSFTLKTGHCGFTSLSVFSSSRSRSVSRLWFILSRLRFSIWGLEIWSSESENVNTVAAVLISNPLYMHTRVSILPFSSFFSGGTPKIEPSCWRSEFVRLVRESVAGMAHRRHSCNVVSGHAPHGTRPLFIKQRAPLTVEDFWIFNEQQQQQFRRNTFLLVFIVNICNFKTKPPRKKNRFHQK